MSQTSKLALVKELIESAESSLRSAKQMMNELTGGKTTKTTATKATPELGDVTREGDDTIVEGMFDGEKMTDKTGQEYPVPANYASKSKLIPGDILKLTIKPDGTFLYKQIGPIERKRVIGTLTYEDGQYKVIATGKAYRVLLASVTYFRGEVGDKITLIVPEADGSDWGAIENVLPREEIDLDIE